MDLSTVLVPLGIGLFVGLVMFGLNTVVNLKIRFSPDEETARSALRSAFGSLGGSTGADVCFWIAGVGNVLGLARLLNSPDPLTRGDVFWIASGVGSLFLWFLAFAALLFTRRWLR